MSRRPGTLRSNVIDEKCRNCLITSVVVLSVLIVVILGLGLGLGLGLNNTVSEINNRVALLEITDAPTTASPTLSPTSMAPTLSPTSMAPTLIPTPMPLTCTSLCPIQNTSFIDPTIICNDVWVQLGIDIDGEAIGDQSGASVSLSADGNTVAIGAIYNNGNGTNTGHTRIYDYIVNSWVQRGLDIDGEDMSSNSGYSVSLSSDGNTVAIGAPFNNGNGTNSGHTRIYDWSGSAWVQRGLDIDGEAADQSGISVSLSASGNTVAIGAFQGGPFLGYTRIYDWSGSSWIQHGLDIDSEFNGDQSGFSVSLSADGNTVAMGAPGNDGNGTDSGHTRIYYRSGIAWVQRGLDIDGEATGDQSGYSVSLSADGNTAVSYTHLRAHETRAFIAYAVF